MNRLSLDTFFDLPRVGGLTLSPDGRRLVLSVEVPAPDRSRYLPTLWELPADGSAPARRLAYSAKGESSPAFLPDGSLAFASGRPDPTVKEDEAEGKVWLLPAGGGEARPLLSVPGGVQDLVAARAADVLLVKAPLFAGTDGLAGDAERAKARREAAVGGMLFEGYPVRYWDHDLGPRHSRLLRLPVPAQPGEAQAGEAQPEDLTPDAAGELDQAEIALAPDGRTALATWWRSTGRAFVDVDLALIGPEGRRLVASGGEFENPSVSPDGRWAVVTRTDRGTPKQAQDVTLWLVDLAGGGVRDLLPGLDPWPAEPVWSADSASVFFAADEGGHRPVYRLDVAGGRAIRLTGEGAFTSLCPAPDGGAVYALRSSYCSPPEVVRLDAGGTVSALPTPGLPVELPGRVEEVKARAADGAEIRAWLVTPRGASAESPAPLALWIHGGPLSSWNSWSWRWCPHLLAERGYAVLLPDPALSTGYGQAFVQRAWGTWGDRVLDDLLAVLDTALGRPDLDGSRTAAMGGSFGGYMANWLAGRTDRFRAIVSHAGLWSMEQFHGTTDLPTFWEPQFGDPYENPAAYEAASPNRNVARVRTPMLVIHGLRDYRVPVSEALRLYTDLRRMGVESKYLFFPDENHWILKPANSRVWYETVLAFLDHHVLGGEWRRPELL